MNQKCCTSSSSLSLTNPAETETVKQDLVEFDIQCDFEYIKSKSKDAFKRLVKTKAKEVALEDLKSKQKQHSKIGNVPYNELKRQTYFNIRKIGVEEIRNIFRYRVRMAKFGIFFRGILGGSNINSE